jgi:L,D-peptidoglycan transpeptidase YkuD (ErfK/YbiS/YcfS/YnhG family)
VDLFGGRGATFHSRASVRPLPRLPNRPPAATFTIGFQSFRCAIGKSGIGVKRREGDFVTPLGRFAIVAWMRRPNRWKIFRADCRAISESDGWCDDPSSWQYNRPVRLPFPHGTEALWREDGLYDLVGVVDFNFRRRILGRGSAIFLHLANRDYRPTAGCIAIHADDLRKIQFRLAAKPQIVVGDVFVRRSPKIAEPTRIRVAPI